MSSLADREKQTLLEVARRALELAVERREPLENFPSNEILHRSGGAFVTLRRRARLRGCVGQLPSKEALVRVVAHCARAAALEDSRFEPVRQAEVAELEIEVSVLSGLFVIAPEEIEVGKHGLLISLGWQRGLLLPQVAAEHGWAAERFLEESCNKAGLGKDAWKDPEARVEAFTAEVFSESDFGLPAQARTKPDYSSSV
ncbi:MAG: AmmeMemoRadiSam system protein A [Candidatus Acidiferrales bacterium]